MSKQSKIAILLDGDGVILKTRDKYCSQRLAEDFGINALPFFKGERYHLCAIGKIDLKKELEKLIVEWNWQGSVDDLLKYWFSYENVVNPGLLGVVEELRKQGVKCFLASDHTKARAENLMQEVGLKKYFDGAFFSADLGYTKEEPEYWRKVLGQLRKLGLDPSKIYFWDDKEANVKMAQSQGVQAYLFEGVDKLRQVLKEDNILGGENDL